MVPRILNVACPVLSHLAGWSFAVMPRSGQDAHACQTPFGQRLQLFVQNCDRLGDVQTMQIDGTLCENLLPRGMRGKRTRALTVRTGQLDSLVDQKQAEACYSVLSSILTRSAG